MVDERIRGQPMQQNPAIHRQPSGDVDIALPWDDRLSAVEQDDELAGEDTREAGVLADAAAE
jgi:hypothetical protein